MYRRKLDGMQFAPDLSSGSASNVLDCLKKGFFLPKVRSLKPWAITLWNVILIYTVDGHSTGHIVSFYGQWIGSIVAVG